jgi:Transposase DDE domain.
MTNQELLQAQEWAETTFGQVELGDMRRTRRAVKAATGMAENASGSLPAQMRSWKEMMALYRLLDEPDVTFDALMQPHWSHTRKQVEGLPVVLLVQDTTDIDLSHHPKTKGLGQVGNEKGRGFLLQTVLAVVPGSREVLGCIMQEPFVRTPSPPDKRRSQRRFRTERETDVWMRLVQRIGSAGKETMVVHVGDRGADMFSFFHACRATQAQFLVRAAQNRRTERNDEEIGYSLDRTRSWPSQESRSFEVPASHGRRARSTQLQLSFGQMTLLPPRNEPRASKEPFELWVIRVWEEQPPEGEEPLEWVLLTSVPTTTLEHAWERVAWYEHRWIVEDYHQCLKTGCRIQDRQIQSVERLFRLLGLFSPIAVRLLQLRALSRQTPDLPAHTLIEKQTLAVVFLSRT